MPFKNIIYSFVILCSHWLIANGQSVALNYCNAPTQRYRFFLGGDTDLFLRPFTQSSGNTVILGSVVTTGATYSLIALQNNAGDIVWSKLLTPAFAGEAVFLRAAFEDTSGGIVAYGAVARAFYPQPCVIRFNSTGSIVSSAVYQSNPLVVPDSLTLWLGLSGYADNFCDLGNGDAGFMEYVDINGGFTGDLTGGLFKGKDITESFWGGACIGVIDKNNQLKWSKIVTTVSNFGQKQNTEFSPAGIAPNRGNLLVTSLFYNPPGCNNGLPEHRGLGLTEYSAKDGLVTDFKSYCFAMPTVVPPGFYPSMRLGGRRDTRRTAAGNIHQLVDIYESLGGNAQSLYLTWDSLLNPIKPTAIQFGDANTFYKPYNNNCFSPTGNFALSAANTAAAKYVYFFTADSTGRFLQQKRLRLSCDIDNNNRGYAPGIAVDRYGAIRTWYSGPVHGKNITEVVQATLQDTNAVEPCVGYDTVFAKKQDFGLLPSNWQLTDYLTNVLVQDSALTLTTVDLPIQKMVICGCGIACDSINITGPKNVCINQTATYTIHKGSCYLKPDFVLDTSLNKLTLLNDTNIQIQFNEAGTFTIKTLINSCNVISDSITVTAHTPAPPCSLGFKDSVLCPGNTTRLYAGRPYATYLWQNATTADTFTVTQPGKYFVTVTDSCGNVSSDTVRITYRQPQPPVNIGPRDTILCAGAAYRLPAPPYYASYLWQNGSTADTCIVTQSGRYYVTVTDSCGNTSSDTVNVTYQQPQPPVNIGSKDTILCTGAAYRLQAQPFYTSYLWQNGSYADTFTVTKTGKYHVTVTDNCGNISSDTVNVEYIVEQLSVTHGISLCKGSTVTISASPGFTSYQWQPNYAIDSPYARVVNLNPTNTTLYTVSTVVAPGCKLADTVTVTVNICANTFYIPTAFTPNGDGHNDVFTPIIQGDIESYSFSIFNRFGQLVYSSQTLGVGWDGLLHGRLQQMGAYVWLCKYTFKNAGTEAKKGTFVLIR